VRAATAPPPPHAVEMVEETDVIPVPDLRSA
jgi:hypothetical protein